ncbi:hypothetical protein B0H16DRAFT_1695470 [Mycena metata]|uniref:F-box domain-containing protein n=1 Tax=Mycena metata TaxID=1033252 RepID=A0AAD7I827_9AGAR|nr:hypothetical protein B0H16DRAFT_1695470 [Mycena metata]
MVLSQICRQLRVNSLGTPELWQAITVESARHGRAPNPSMVGLWMSRAGILPRDISFTTRDIERGTQILEASLEYSLQWRDVELKVPMESYAPLVNHHGPFPFLRSLRLSMNSGVWEGQATVPVQGAPLLRELIITDFPAVTADVAWGQLTTLRMDVHEAAPGISILQHCTSLVDLHFALLDPIRTLPSIPPVILPSLRSLFTAARSILPFVTTPGLEELNIWGLGFSGDINAVTASLQALLARSDPPLRILCFRVPNIDAAAFQAFLQAASTSVVELILTLHFPTGLDTLISVLQDASLLPALTTLRIVEQSRAAADTMPFDAVLGTVRARREVSPGRASLQLFSMSLYNRGSESEARVPPLSVLGKFNALADEGLRVRIANHAGVLVDRQT